MFFFSLGLFSLAIWFLPWWGLGVTGLVLGFFIRDAKDFTALQVALAGGLAWSALAFIQDGRSHGLISARMSGLFHLPSPVLMFAVVALLGAMTAGLPFQAGLSLKAYIKR